MIIEELLLKDFLPFRGKQVFQFSFKKDRNLTLVLAPNNTGKTSIIRALEFLLYGANSETKLGFPCLATVQALDAKQEEECYVQIRFRHGDKRYTAKRGLRFFRQDAKDMRVAEVRSTVGLIYHDHTTERRETDSEVITSFLSNLIPREMFDFYFFKGEELAQTLLRPKKSLGIPEQLRKLLYQREWQSVIDTIDVVERDVARKAKALKNEQEQYQQLFDRKQELEGRRREVRERLTEWKNKLSEAEAERKRTEIDVETLIGRVRPDARAKLEEKKARLNRVKAERHRIQEDRKSCLGRDSSLLLLRGVVADVHDVLDAVKKERALPPDISETILGEILQSAVCICGRGCGPGSDAAAAIDRLRQRSLKAEVAEDLWRLHGNTGGTGPTGIVSRAQQAMAVIQQQHESDAARAADEQKLQDEIRELEAAVDESAERQLREAKLAREMARKSVEELQDKHRSHAATLRHLDDEFNRVDTALRETARQKSRGDKFGGEVRICHQLRDTAERCSSRLKDAIYKELRSSVAASYDEIVTDGSRAIVDAESLLPAIQRSGRVDLKTGGGQDQVLVLCYLISLAKLRAEINHELRKWFSVTRFYEQGFFMDSVFGQMQGEYKRKVSQLLPKHMAQLVIFLADQQWDEYVESGIKDYVTDVYGIELSSPRHKKEESHYRYSVGGKKFTLLRNLPAGDEAFSRICKVPGLEGARGKH